MATPGQTIDKTALRIEAVCLFREFAKKPFSLIDQILGLEPGIARKTYEKNQDAYTANTKVFAKNSLQRFYKDQITILQALTITAPVSIKLWQDILMDPGASQAAKERAAKEIREWTKLFLASKSRGSIRDLIPEALLEQHDEAEELGGHLAQLLSSSLDLPDVEPS